MMKSRYYLTISLVVMASSCKKEPLPKSSPSDSTVISTNSAGAESKNFLDEVNSDYTTALGLLYSVGENKDVPKGLTLLHKAAGCGSLAAIYRLGRIYLQGTIVPKNELEAFNYLQLAMNNGSIPAKVALGCFYRDGIVVNRSRKTAYDFFVSAATKGNGDAFYHLGVFYRDGVVVSESKAFDCFRRSVDKGCTKGVVDLARMYMLGIGTDIDYEKSQGYMNMVSSWDIPKPCWGLENYMLVA